MSFTLSESFKSEDIRSGLDSRSYEVIFVVIADPGDVVKEEDVEAFLLAGGAPTTFANLPFREITGIERINPESYEATIRYEVTEQTQEAQPGQTDSFDTTGGSVQRTHAFEVVETIGIADEMGAAINYDGEKIQGVSLPSPAFKYTVTVQKLDSEVTDAFIQTLFDLTDTVNDAVIKFFEIRELLFLGAVGSRTQENAVDAQGNDIEDRWEITYQFAGRKSEIGQPIGEFILPLKKGWDYVSVTYQDKADTTSKTIIRTPRTIKILRVFEEADFSLLGIDL